MRRSVWHEGWWSRATRLDSPNFGARPNGTEISLLVIHSICLPPGRYGGDAIERLFTNRLDWNEHAYFGEIRGLQVSSHFVIRRTGQLQQFVACDQRAWHAGDSAWQGRSNCNDFSVGIELEGMEGDTFDPCQYRALAKLAAALQRRFPIRAVAGHEHVAPGRKTDPGPGFDWLRLQGDLGWPSRCFPGVDRLRP